MSQALLKLAKVDKSKYDARTLSIIDVMACYFLDMTYNVLYLRVKDMKKAKKIANITDGYKSALMVYYKGLSKNDNLTKCIDSIQRTFNELPGFSNVSFLDCINNIVEQFSPKEAFDGFDDQQRRVLLKKVMIDVNSAFIHHILKSRLGMIIDDRLKKENVDILKNELMDLFLLEREKIMSEYYGVVLNVEKTRTISTQTAERLQKTISDTVTKMIIYKKKAEKFEEMSKQLRFELDQLKSGKFAKSTNTNASSTSIPKTVQPDLDDDILDISDNIEVDEQDSNDSDDLNVDEPIQKPQVSQPIQKPQVSQPIQKPQVSQPIQKPQVYEPEPDDSSDIFEDEPVRTTSSNKESNNISNKPTNIPKITLSDLSISDDEKEPEKNEFEQELDNIGIEGSEEENAPSIIQDNYTNINKQDIQELRNSLQNSEIRKVVHDDPLATESETIRTAQPESTAIKIKKGGKLKIKKDVPVKKVQFT